jgi:hypothetical protein
MQGKPSQKSLKGNLIFAAWIEPKFLNTGIEIGLQTVKQYHLIMNSFTSWKRKLIHLQSTSIEKLNKTMDIERIIQTKDYLEFQVKMASLGLF